MPVTAYIERMLESMDHQQSEGEPDSPQFRQFVRAVGRQIRSPYHARHEASETLGFLASMWQQALVRTSDEPVVQGWLDGRNAVLTTSMPDQPFIVDTIRLQIRRLGATYAGGFNAVVPIGRDDAGRIQSIAGSDDRLESLVRTELEGVDPERFDEFLADVRSALMLAQAMVADFGQIVEHVESAAHRFNLLAARHPDQADGLRETAEFLQWLMSDNFVFMSAQTDDVALGIARLRESGAVRLPTTDGGAPWSDAIREYPVSVRKGALESMVHRFGRIDEIRVEVPALAGDAPRPLILQGLFTYRAVTQPSRHAPLLRKVLAAILRDQESKPGSYRYKGIANVFDSLPTEYLFTTDRADIVAMIERVLEAEQEQKAGVHMTQDPDAGVTFVLAAMPKVRWTDKLREKIQADIVATTGASYCDHGVFFGHFDTMLAHFYLTGANHLSDDEIDTLRERILDRTRPWIDRTYECLVDTLGETEADRLLHRYGNAFPDAYQGNVDAARSVRDIQLCEQLADNRPVAADVFVDRKGRINLRILQSKDILLSDILPVLDHFGLIVIDQFADYVQPRDTQTISIDTFRLKGVWGLEDDAVLERADLLTEGIEAVFANRVADDQLNRIVLRAGVPWQAVDAIRAYNGYARQLGLRYTLVRVQEILLARPAMVRGLWEFFQAKFDPARADGRDKAMAAAGEALNDGLREIQDHDQDVAFRTFYNLIDSTLRTNFWRRDRLFHYISFKIDCAKVWNMPSPRMMYEIYVHHRDMEGLHLRGGPIARGGIRWSDREDYRREILDLVSTQMVKNVLIVPEGAKGGFFMKRPISDPAVRRRRADELYQVLIRGMLDVTDNIVDGQVVHPPDVVNHDGEDPYLVVAADKGTAHLSDTANRLSRGYGFWLDDAFASGGSNGYDHKVVGITARGGWMTTRRRFMELSLDPYKDEFTCVGIGDPSGDVFGNGVIETPKMKLLAAFNHVHVFLDPKPDLEASFKERKRLFDAAKGWDEYDTSIISEGGGIFSRRARSIKLTPETQQLLGVLKDELPVDAVIRQILRMGVDLLWNGGIGTYVKANHETHADAGDPTNDTLRINADELRCRIIGEGGNLGFTQAARVEFALHGGAVGTDAIDNSGGVDMSDHEVNLKILMRDVVSSGALDMDARNTLLESLTDEVADQVLANSDTHGRQLSLDVVRSTRDPMLFSPVIDWACQRSGRNRAELKLPSDDEIRRRASGGKGLTAPELAVLSAHVKMHVFKDLMAGSSDEVPDFDNRVLRYFPGRIQEEFAGYVSKHMLHKAIGMTTVTTDVVGEAGAAFFPLVMELTGASAATVARAWFLAMEMIDADAINGQIEASEASANHRYRAWTDLTDSVFRLVVLWLAPGEPGLDDEDRSRISEVLGRLPRTRGSDHEGRIGQRVTKYTGRGIPEAVAQKLATIGELTIAREIALAHQDDDRLAHTIVRYLAVGEASKLLPAIRTIEARRALGRWDTLALGTLRGRYIRLVRSLFEAVPLGAEAHLGIDRVAQRLGRGPLRVLEEEVDRILGDQPDPSTLLVAEERVRALLARQSLAGETTTQPAPNEGK